MGRSALANLPDFTPDGVLPPGDHALTLAELKQSALVRGPKHVSIVWDIRWRSALVDRLGALASQLWAAGIDEIFVNGSFVEDKPHPNDIDGYFACDRDDFFSGDLARRLNLLDPFKVWTWDSGSRRPVAGHPRQQLPMWHRYRVELYPHFPGLRSGIRGPHGYELEFPAAFRLTRSGLKPKGIVQLVR